MFENTHLANDPRFPRKLAFDEILLLSGAAQGTRQYHHKNVPGWTAEKSKALPLSEHFPTVQVCCPPTSSLMVPEERGLYRCLAQAKPAITTFTRKFKR
jgi:hypothetical protein